MVADGFLQLVSPNWHFSQLFPPPTGTSPKWLSEILLKIYFQALCYEKITAYGKGVNFKMFVTLFFEIFFEASVKMEGDFYSWLNNIICNLLLGYHFLLIREERRENLRFKKMDSD